MLLNTVAFCRLPEIINVHTLIAYCTNYFRGGAVNYKQQFTQESVQVLYFI